MATKKILVTGGFGYVGSRLTQLLVDKNYDVRVLDLCLYGHDGKKALRGTVEHIQGDIRDPEVVKAAVKGIDTIIHLAAISNDPTGDIDEVLTRQVNFDAVGLLVTMAQKAGVKRFINASSSSVFGTKSENNIKENLEPEPITYYSKYKMLSEWIINGASSEKFCTVNIRPATVCGYSPRQRLDLTVNKLTMDALSKGKMTIHGGEQRRPNVGMADMINIYQKLIEIDGSLINGQTFNFGFENLKVIEIGKRIQNILADKNVQIEVTPTTDNRDYHISSEKILKQLNYEPQSKIELEVAELKAHFDAGEFSNVEDIKYYNMKSMKLDRSDKAYSYLT
ncbi:MAG: SDR family oxidoreductase [Bdellovibrionaceae bacterium]|nr:SDR family oxidoreductase [Bdellovibrio sp.]